MKRLLVVAVVALLAGYQFFLARAEAPATPPFAASVNSQRFPPEAQKTLTLIHRNGPFPFDRDGITFGNREKRLPTKPHGYYREYTVPTPGARHRGARRIVCGGNTPSSPDRCYYTADHYQSFQPIPR